MFRKFLPKTDIFFQDLARLADKAVEITAAYRALVEDIPHIEEHIVRVKRIEDEADEIAHDSLARLHRTFVTPIDRNEIHRLTRRIDDIIDHIEAAAQCIYHYEITTIRPRMFRLLEILEKQVPLVRKAVTGLSDLKHVGDLRSTLIQINTLENEADTLMLEAFRALFREEKDPMAVIKWKEVFELLELATDHCENVADLIENVILEYA
jgi:uncharacterized protein Yka (UPF0111/DUF47 family)